LPPVKLAVAAIQMSSVTHDVSANLASGDDRLRQARLAGADLVVLPELFNTGYDHRSDYAPIAEERDGPTIAHLKQRSRQWKIGIAAGFVEREGHHLYDSLAFVTPDGGLHVYRKRNLVFWERARFNGGRTPLVVATKWGRIGFAVCADMIYRKVWNDYRGRIDVAIVSAAWPDFADRHTGRKHWLLGRLGPLAAVIPGRVAQDLGVPVVFANQCGETLTKVPLLESRIPDRFAGRSSVSDGRHGPPVLAGIDEDVLVRPITIHSQQGMKLWRTTSPSVPAA
jgi:predicted amidohydrolase